ncbi:MAG: DUF2309 domain-containing protein [Gemmataceae bacterium]
MSSPHITALNEHHANGHHAHARGDRLVEAIDQAAKLLPTQGPITVFIAQNTLNALEHLRFEEALRRGKELLGCEPYLTEDRYRTELSRGRIRFDALRRILREELAEGAEDGIVGLTSRLDLRLTMLQYPIWALAPSELDYYLAETQALRRARSHVSAAARGRFLAESRRWVMRDLRGRSGKGGPAWADALLQRFGVKHIESWDEHTWEAMALESLWQVCQAGVAGVPAAEIPQPPSERHRTLLWRVTGIDSDLWVHDILVRYCAAFLDQGVSHWPLPDRAEGLYRSFLLLYSQGGGPPDLWLRKLSTEARRLLDLNTSAIDSIRESLYLLGVEPEEWSAFLSATLLALRGWGGMVREVETRSDRVAFPIPEGSLFDFLALRLLLDRLSAAHIAATTLDFQGPLDQLREVLHQRLPSTEPPTAAQRAFSIFQLAQVLGWSPAELHRLKPDEWESLLAEIEGFDSIERRRVFHLAYERRFRAQALDAILIHNAETREGHGPTNLPPRFQVVTCLDEREESFRRHLEEVAPDCETFGAAGFFNVPMYYRGAADAHFVPLCPIIMTPGHWVEEHPCDGLEDTHRKQTITRKAFGKASQGFRAGTRSAAAGALITSLVGPLAAVPLVARILFPRLAARIENWLGRSVFSPPATRLKLERSPDQPPGPQNGNLGFTVAEMAEKSARLLRDIGLTRGFSRLVFILGHGSDSLNNPHKSAYDCGACGGSPGAPNGRALAQMLNDPRVRSKIAAEGITIPQTTWFIGGCHNTCDDSVTCFDLDRVPASHADDVARARADMEAASAWNAHERCRRFMSAPLDQDASAARLHVENRSADLAQVRPELGHATNAICVVGRRSRTRGLFFDRRAFLVSYDPLQDDASGSTLARLMGAAVPVCGGISLQYFFSHMDSPGYGAGTKLPHNVTALLGVMDGAASDLRTGLPWQMVEIHEPVRLLFVVETTPEVLIGIMDRNPDVGRMIRNGWVQLTLLDPVTATLRIFRNGRFEPYTPAVDHLPKAATSADWYRGWRDHLEFAQIGR